MSKIILHIDLNAFFVRCEELKNPSLEGKPVIIGRTGRGGIVSTCSYKAREFGVRSGMPTYKALQLCPKAIMIDGYYDNYVSKSNEFFNYIKKFSTIIEPMSIDECFVDMTDLLRKQKDPIAFLEKLQQGLFRETGLKCSIGVAPTKFLAKMASDMKKPMGITVIRRKDVRKMLDPLPIEDFFGIGKKTAPRLREIGINTIGDLAEKVNNEDAITINHLGKFYFAIKDWVNGYGSDVVDTEPFDPQSVGHSTTLPHDSDDIVELKEYLKKLADRVSMSAINENKVGKSVQIVLKDTEFKTINRSKRLQKHTNKSETIYETAVKLLENNYDGRLVRLIGITLQNLKDPGEIVEQLSIFDNYEEIKEQNAVRLLIGELNRKMRGSTFKTAGDLLREKKNETK